MVLPFLSGRKKIVTSITSLLVPYICCAYNSFKTGIKSWINTKKVHRAIQFNQEAQLKPCIDIIQNYEHNQKMILKRISIS